ncbi:tetratricopeptide repeat protein [Leuconostoc rapi]|uniref:tetratricopeptide repeat protein n=1 Tax=Leuconostoc rapi TaxID=1406906 RepID=UPI001958D455|nr:tetratricopeptide repeat protein [Leuconostoc rapi]MBM7435805.1 tetratricopeptide (TPR) repeat protein [Leuconostoc rapi]
MVSNYAQKMLDALSSGQLDEAQHLFAQSLRHDDENLIYSLAEELYALGFLNQSRRAYKKLLEKYPEEDEIRAALADIAIEDGEIDEAQNYLAQIQPDSPSYLRSLLVKADIYQTEGLNESAEYSLLQAENIAPEEEVIQFALAEFYFANQSFQKAIKRYRALLLKGQREISRVDIVARIGVAYAQIGNYDHAIGYLEQIKPERMTMDTRFQLAILYQETQHENEAITLFNEILASDPKYTSIYPLLGKAYEQLNQIEDAYRTYQAGLAQDETNIQLYRLAATAAQKMGDLDAAENYYHQALKIDDADVTTIINLTDLYLEQQRFDEVITDMTKYLADDLTDPQFYWTLARAYQAVGDDNKAQHYWHDAVPLFQDNVQFLLDLITWYHEQGQQQLEIDTLKHYLFLAPNDSDMQMRLEDLAF